MYVVRVDVAETGGLDEELAAYRVQTTEVRDHPNGYVYTLSGERDDVRRWLADNYYADGDYEEV